MAYESVETGIPQKPQPRESVFQGKRISRFPDGTITVDDDGAPPEQADPTFSANLATSMGTAERRSLAQKLIEYVEIDRKSREEWENREKRAILMMGMRDYTKDELAKVPGRHHVTHPMLAEAAVHFQANAISEMFPATGPVKSRILGKASRERADQAQRVSDFMNYYLTVRDRGYFPDTDQMLLYLPMSGSVFRKGGRNWATGIPELRYVKASNFIANYQGTDLITMPRYTHEFIMGADEVIAAMEGGRFADVRLRKVFSSFENPDRSADVADARVASYHEDDRAYPVYEIHADIYLKSDPLNGSADRADQRRALPYVIVVETTNQEILHIRRNWKQEDRQRQKRVWFAHHKYLPGLGFYGFGLPHVIGSLGESASGAVNALLDAAYAANFQGGFKTKEARSLAGEAMLEHGTWKDTDLSAEEMAKAFYTPPFKEPSPALFSLLELLVDGGRRFVGTTDAAVGDQSNLGPVGTTVALIEQAKKPLTAIHKRLHMSMNEEFRILTDLIHAYIPNEYVYDQSGETRNLLRSDFDAREDVVSVSDPNIASNEQRIQRDQAVVQLHQQAPDLYPPAKRAAAHRRLLEAMHVDAVDEVGPEVQTPTYCDALTENSQMIAGHPVQAFETQAHDAHLAVHQHGRVSVQSMPMDPAIQQAVLQSFDAHMREHMGMYYRQQVLAQAGLPPIPVTDTGTPTDENPQMEAAITAAVMQRLPPPPPPPQPADETGSQIARDDALAQAKIKRDDAAHDSEEARKQAAFEAEERRKDAALAGEEGRKDTQAKTDIIRGNTKHVVSLRAAAGKAEQGLEHGAAKHEQALAHGDDKHVAALVQAGRAGDQKIEQGQAAHMQALEQEAAAARQAAAQADAAHQQELDQASDRHMQAVEQGAEAHQQSLEQGAESHGQSMKQSAEAAKAKAKAKKGE